MKLSTLLKNIRLLFGREYEERGRARAILFTTGNIVKNIEGVEKIVNIPQTIEAYNINPNKTDVPLFKKGNKVFLENLLCSYFKEIQTILIQNKTNKFYNKSMVINEIDQYLSNYGVKYDPNNYMYNCKLLSETKNNFTGNFYFSYLRNVRQNCLKILSKYYILSLIKSMVFITTIMSDEGSNPDRIEHYFNDYMGYIENQSQIHDIDINKINEIKNMLKSYLNGESIGSKKRTFDDSDEDSDEESDESSDESDGELQGHRKRMKNDEDSEKEESDNSRSRSTTVYDDSEVQDLENIFAQLGKRSRDEDDEGIGAGLEKKMRFSNKKKLRHTLRKLKKTSRKLKAYKNKNLFNY